MNVQALMQQAQKMQEQMQKQMKKAQDELAVTEVTGESGAGLVKVTMTGKHDVKRVAISPDLMQEEKDILEDLIAAAVNDAVRKVDAITQEKMAGASAGMGLPAGFKLPF